MAPSRLGVAAVAALGLICTLLPVAVATPKEKPWAGYVIAPGKRADSGLVGARKVGSRITYRIDPRGRPTAGGYRKATRLGDTRAAARAAWILAKFGDVRLADQAAAVDIATYALLAGQGIGSKRTQQRLRSTGRSREITALAQQMLRRSTRQAGPYAVTLTTRPATVGGQLRLTASVRSAVGAAVRDLTVTVVGAGQAPRVRTNAGGIARFGFDATEVGYRPVRVTVGGLPTSRVLVRRPHNRKASRIAIAGRRTSHHSRTRLITRAVPTLTLTSPKVDAEVGKAFTAGFTMTGTAGAPARAVQVALFGPFPAGASTDCTGTPVVTGSSVITGDGSYTTPALAVALPGLYFWSARAAGSDLNTEARSCGAASRVTRRPSLDLDAGAGGRLRFRVTALTSGYDATAVAALYGPYAKKAGTGCGAARKAATRKVQVTTDRRYRTEPPVQVKKEGWYAWRLTMPADSFSHAISTKCRAAGSMVRLG